MQDSKHLNRLVAFATMVIFVLPGFSQLTNKATVGTAANTANAAIARLEKNIPVLMKRDLIPGLTAALIWNGKIAWSKTYGYVNASTKQPATNKTIFEAASLTKVVTSYAVLKLVDRGLLDLDSPLNKYLGNNYEVGDDNRINLITARHVLTHSTGFPNWRQRNSKTLPIMFNPGEKWSYSGEGFVYLSKVAEKIAGVPFDELVNKTVFVPLGMTKSSLVWRDEYDSTKIFRHNWLGEMSYKDDSKEVNAAASLHTTAEDYAKFMVAILRGDGLKQETAKAMISIQFKANPKTPQVAWGLGVGLENTATADYFWHWGDQGDSKCYMVGDIKNKNGLAYFTNSANGLSIAPEMLTMSIGGTHSALTMLNYPKHDPEAVTFYRAVIGKGVSNALADYNAARKNGRKSLSEDLMNGIGYQLMRSEKMEEAIAVWKQNTIDFPNSGNAWDSLGEGYMTIGENALAIQCYEKAVNLDPNNTNAAEMVEKLKSL